MTISCLGGWCKLREQCDRYSAGGDELVERLCIPGQDGVSDDVSVHITRPVGTWGIRTWRANLLRSAQPFDGLVA